MANAMFTRMYVFSIVYPLVETLNLNCTESIPQRTLTSGERLRVKGDAASTNNTFVCINNLSQVVDSFNLNLVNEAENNRVRQKVSKSTAVVIAEACLNLPSKIFTDVIAVFKWILYKLHGKSKHEFRTTFVLVPECVIGLNTIKPSVIYKLTILIT